MLRHVKALKNTTSAVCVRFFGKASTISIESLIMKNRLRWVGHVVRMDNSRVVNEVFYSELKYGQRKRGGNSMTCWRRRRNADSWNMYNLLIELGCYKLAHYLGKRYGNFRSSCRYTDIGNGASLNSLELSFNHFKCFIPPISCYELFF